MQNGSNRNPGGSLLLKPEVASRPRAAEREPIARAGVRIANLAISHSDEVLSQAQVLERLGLTGNEFAEGIFARCGVKHRHLELSVDFLGRTLQGRTAQIEQELLAHSIRAVEQLELDPQQVGTVLSASLYSLGCPSLAHCLVEHFQMDPSTDKYHISGVGCAGAVPLMRLAAQALREHPEKHALVVAADSMSGLLTSATSDDPKAKTVGSSIFGDGCAAAVLSSDPRAEGPLILDSQVHQISDTLDAVSLAVNGEDSYLHLARELPDLAGAGLPEVLDGFLRRNRLDRSDIDHWMVHPGGRRIIGNVQSALELSNEDLDTSWDALADHGNVGTSSILYVLKGTIERYQPEPGERGMMVTIGPGVTLGLMLLGW